MLKPSTEEQPRQRSLIMARHLMEWNSQIYLNSTTSHCACGQSSPQQVLLDTETTHRPITMKKPREKVSN